MNVDGVALGPTIEAKGIKQCDLLSAPQRMLYPCQLNVGPFASLPLL